MNLHPDEPLSWLTLERYALGELSAAEHVAVEQRLATSAEDRACLAAIRSDQTVLPPLPGVPLRAKRRVISPAWSVGLAAAAALLVIFLRPPQSATPGAIAPRAGTKGGEVAITVANEHGPGVRTFAPGERLKVLVTCPAALRAPMRIVAFQDEERFEPLPAAQLACGNLVPWPGAFELDGIGAVEVCVTWNLQAKAARSARELGADAVCTRLTPR